MTQVDDPVRYEKTNDLTRMLTSAQLADAIIKELRRQIAGQPQKTNIFEVVPARSATFMEYKAGATTALVWNEGKRKEKVDFPLEEGWRISDGNPFGVPNGHKATRDDPDALYLMRYLDRDFFGPVGLGSGWNGVWGRGFSANGIWSADLGVALVGNI